MTRRWWMPARCRHGTGARSRDVPCDDAQRRSSRKGPCRGRESTPGGQLVQATDQYLAVRGARIVVFDAEGVRAPVVASWLRQMGWDACVLKRAFMQPCRTKAPRSRTPHLCLDRRGAGGSGPTPQGAQAVDIAQACVIAPGISLVRSGPFARVWTKNLDPRASRRPAGRRRRLGRMGSRRLRAPGSA